MMTAPDLDTAYPCELLTAVAKGYLAEYVSGDARRKGWAAFTEALDRARLDHGADDDVMPWDTAPAKTKEPAASITREAVHQVMQAMLAETVSAGGMSDTAWQQLTIERLQAIEKTELGQFSDKACDICGKPRHADKADRRRCENRRYRARKAALARNADAPGQTAA